MHHPLVLKPYVRIENLKIPAYVVIMQFSRGPNRCFKRATITLLSWLIFTTTKILQMRHFITLYLKMRERYDRSKLKQLHEFY